MNIRQLEKDLAKEAARLRKQNTGRGPLECKVRIMDTMIFIRSRFEVSPIERLMYKHIEEYNGVDRLIEEYKKMMFPVMNNLISIIGVELNITDLKMSYDSSTATSFILLTLNKDLEKLFSSGALSKETSRSISHK